MKLDIPFDENIYTKQVTLNFDLVWKENLKNNKKRLYWAIPALAFGAFLLLGDLYVGFIFIGVGIHYAINYYDYYQFYKKSKSTYFELVKSEIEGQKVANENSIWEFNDDHFGYKYYKFEAKIKWTAFKGYRVIDNNLFFDLEAGNNFSYILGKSEVGQEKFEEIIEFTKRKLEAKTN